MEVKENPKNILNHTFLTIRIYIVPYNERIIFSTLTEDIQKIFQ